MICDGSVYNIKLASTLESPEEFQEPVDAVAVRTMSVSSTSTVVNPGFSTQTSSKALSVKFVDPFKDPVNPLLDPVENNKASSNSLDPFEKRANFLRKRLAEIRTERAANRAASPTSTISHFLLDTARCAKRSSKTRLLLDGSLKTSTSRRWAEDW